MLLLHEENGTVVIKFLLCFKWDKQRIFYTDHSWQNCIPTKPGPVSCTGRLGIESSVFSGSIALSGSIASKSIFTSDFGPEI